MGVGTAGGAGGTAQAGGPGTGGASGTSVGGGPGGAGAKGGAAGASGTSGSAGTAGGSGFGGGAGVGGGSGGGGGNPGEACGNGVREAAEKCDGADLDGVNCASLLGTGVQGTLGCRADCTFDASACTTCGNGTIDAGEECEDGPSVKEGRCVGCRLACPDGGKAFGGHCYAVYKSFKGWDDARKECEKKKAHLVTIGSSTENEHVWLLVGKQQYNPTGYWLGLSDLASENTFVWVTAEDVVFTAWGANEPNDFFNEDCASFGVSDGRWSDVGCGVIRGFVCELDDPLKP